MDSMHVLTLLFASLALALASISDEELMSCYLRAESHYVLGDPDKGKFFSFTFEPPLLENREALDPCLINCLIQPVCAAVLFYNDATSGTKEETEDSDDGDSQKRCLSVITDEAMRLEVMFGNVADVFIKRGDQKCRQNDDSGEMAQTTTPILLGRPDKGYYGANSLGDLLMGAGSVRRTGRDHKRQKVQLNALNFLWGHQIYAHIHHNGQKQPEENDTTDDESTTLPIPSMRDESQYGTPPPTMVNFGGSYNGGLYKYVNGGTAYTGGDGNMEPMGKEVLGYRTDGPPAPTADAGEDMMPGEDTRTNSDGEDMADTGMVEDAMDMMGEPVMVNADVPETMEIALSSTNEKDDIEPKDSPTDAPVIVTEAPSPRSTTSNTATSQVVPMASSSDVASISDKIAFSATLSSTLSVTSAQKSCPIIFDNALLNAGGAYNTTSGEFKAPASGIYVFTADIQSPQGTLASVKLYHNSEVVHSIWACGRNTGDVGVGSATIALALVPEDKVRLELFYDSGYTYCSKDVSRFTGFKL